MIDERTLNEIRRAESCLNYLTKSKHGKSKHGGYICPSCRSGTGGNQTGAVYYYDKTNTCYCHVCNKFFDPIDLYQITHGVDFPTAAKALADKHNIAIEHDNEPYNAARHDFTPKEGKPLTNAENAKQGQTQAQEPDFTEYYTRCRERLTEQEAIEYLDKRGISLKTAAAYNMGYDPQADPCNFPGAADDAKKWYPKPTIILPVSKKYFTFRPMEGKSKGHPKGTHPEIFNTEALYTADHVFITEGFFDALSIIEAGGQAIATNSKSNWRKVIEQLKNKPSPATMILCFDNDPDGQEAQAELQEELPKIGAFFSVVDNSFFNGTKDANEALVKDPGALNESVMFEIAAANEKRYQAEKKLNQEEEERKQRTGAQMIDDFLDIVKTKRYEPRPIGITDIDRAIGGGLIRQNLVLLGAAPGAGKTALTAWIFETMAANGYDCLFLNLEMAREQMLARSISRITASNGNGITPTTILQGYKWSPEQEQAITAAAEEYKTKIAPHMVYNPDGVTPELDCILEYIEKEAQRAEAAHEPAPSVVIDYLQIIRGREREEDSAIIKRAVAALKDFAIKHNTIVFCIMAQNRKANESGKATQEAGRDTSALEYSADLQMNLTYTVCLPPEKTKGMKQPEQQGRKAKAEDVTENEKQYRSLVITKCRWGTPGKAAHLRFNGETMRFTQTAPEFREEDSNNLWANAKSE